MSLEKRKHMVNVNNQLVTMDQKMIFFCFVNADSNCADKVIFIICPTLQLILVLGSNVSATPIGQMGLKMG